MIEVLESAAINYKKLEDQHFKNINIMKEVEERARKEMANRTQMEVELNEMREKVRKLESECILSIGKAREEGKEERKVLGKEELWMRLKPNSKWCTIAILGTDGSPH